MKNNLVTALVARPAGEIIELPGYAAVGVSGAVHTALQVDQTGNMPYGSELMFLPDRRPVLFNRRTGRLQTLKENPYAPGEPVFPVAAFNSPGYVITAVSAFQEKKAARCLPLFSYGAVGWYRGNFRTAAVRVDPARRQDLRLMRREQVLAGIDRMRRQLPRNRLRAHLEKCALEYGCPAAKNFFIGRCEAPLPTATQCNARCLGCLSLQQDGIIDGSQERIAFTPAPEEIVAIALAHIKRVKKSVVSFGQGCEGDPLLAAAVIEPAIAQIRRKTRRGTINMNTNGSRPDMLRRLVAAGLDSVRISMNSVRKACYEAYFRPRGYGFADVLRSIEIVLAQNKFLSINYLNCPGFTDTPAEVAALVKFLHRYPVNMIQWRNLNFDPLRYWRKMNAVGRPEKPLGMRKLLERIRRQFPQIKHGYFNPPREKFEN